MFEYIKNIFTKPEIQLSFIDSLVLFSIIVLALFIIGLIYYLFLIINSWSYNRLDKKASKHPNYLSGKISGFGPLHKYQKWQLRKMIKELKQKLNEMKGEK